MKIGDLVMHKNVRRPASIGIIVDEIEKKVWRSSIQGKKIDWKSVDPEPHAVVLFPHNCTTVDIPTCDLEKLDD